jgi:hypothetical protein
VTRVAYAGLVVHDGQLAHAYVNVDQRGRALGAAELYRESLCDAQVGDLLEVPASANGSIPKGVAHVVGSHGDPQAVAEWRARHGATLAAEQAWRHPMAEAFELLAPIREAYRKLDEERQGVLIAQVVRYIVRS